MLRLVLLLLGFFAPSLSSDSPPPADTGGGLDPWGAPSSSDAGGGLDPWG